MCKLIIAVGLIVLIVKAVQWGDLYFKGRFK